MDSFTIFGILLALLVRFCVSRFPHSGEGKPPMFGDYEAQRHWMEITTNLKVSEWYRNSSDNDLLYWGLDYPPLTAYHMMVNGYVAKAINGSWVQLHASRGLENYYHKLFMRYSVVITDILIYVPAIIYYWSVNDKPRGERNKAVTSTLVLLYPGLILIDFGHFQYNCASLGFTILAVTLAMRRSDALAAIAFCLSLNYKQMSLYHAAPFFFYYLGLSLRQPDMLSKLKKLTLIGAAVILTFGIIWLPFLLKIESALDVIKRLFPFNRGIFEDKVANFWYCSSLVFKWHKSFPVSRLALFSAIATGSALISSSFHLLFNPSVRSLRYALINSSLIFFLFSFQVHEKSILLPATAVLLLMEDHPLACNWFLIISTFSMQPLLLKDGLMVPYFALTALYLIFMFNCYGNLGLRDNSSWSRIFRNALFLTSLFGCVALDIGSLTIKPPPRYPHLHSLLNSVYSFGHFILFLIFFHLHQFSVFDVLIPKSDQFTRLKKKAA